MNRRVLTAIALATAAVATLATSRPTFEAEDETYGPNVTLAEDGARVGHAITVTATADAFPAEAWESTLWVDADASTSSEGAGELALSLLRHGVEVGAGNGALDLVAPLVLQVRDDDALSDCEGACTVTWEMWAELSGELTADLTWKASTRVDSHDAAWVELPYDTLSIQITALEE